MKYILFLLALNNSCKKANAGNPEHQTNVNVHAQDCSTKVDPAAQSWETYSPSGGNQVIRLKVPCGWLVKTVATNTAPFIFMLDPNHLWITEGFRDD